MIIAHRGYHKIEPENTLAAFAAALKAGAQGIECDLRLTADGVPVLAHYDRVKVNGRKMRVSKSTWHDLKNRRPNKEKSIINLEELLEFLEQARCFAFLEVKKRDLTLARAIAEKIGRHELWDKVCVAGFPFYLAGALRAQEEFPKLKIIKLLLFPMITRRASPCFYGVAFGWLDKFLTRNTFKLFFPRERLKKFNEDFIKQGLKTFVGVIDTVEDFHYFQSAGIVNIVTDKVKEAARFAITEEISL